MNCNTYYFNTISSGLLRSIERRRGCCALFQTFLGTLRPGGLLLGVVIRCPRNCLSQGEMRGSSLSARRDRFKTVRTEYVYHDGTFTKRLPHRFPNKGGIGRNL
jgi:hypothetical protein